MSVSKPESEKAIRHLCHVWAETLGPVGNQHHYSFSAFTRWLEENHYSHLLKFKSVMGPEEDAERWFDQEFKQMLQN